MAKLDITTEDRGIDRFLDTVENRLHRSTGHTTGGPDWSESMSTSTLIKLR